MAVIKVPGQQIEVKDGERIKLAAMKLGIPFSCEKGECRTCFIEIVEGEENLGPLTDAEERQGLDRNFRLACQCTIEHGEVEIDF